jgi:sec-independent protein translocase protein TatC
MPKVLRPIGHEERLSIVDHLDELRSRLMVCVAALVVAFGLCFWQNHLLLNLVNRPLNAATSATQTNHIGGLTTDSVKASRDFAGAAALFGRLARSSDLSLSDSALIEGISADLAAAAKSLPQKTPKDVPITIGVGETFTTTLKVCAYFALLLTLPVLLYESYAFIIPALSREERQVALPIMIMAPILFLIGVVFTYLVVLPAAVRFLQGYNADEFQSLVQASPLYSFEILTMAGIGLAFQLPMGLLGLHRVGVIDGNTLTKHWRYATVVIAVIAAAMPGSDPVTTGLEALPLAILFIASIVMLKIVDRRDAARAAAELVSRPDADEAGGSGS